MVTWRTSENHKTVKIGDACVEMAACPGQFGVSANICQHLSTITSCYGNEKKKIMITPKEEVILLGIVFCW